MGDWLILVLFVVLALASRYAADSRDGRDWQQGWTRIDRRPTRVHMLTGDVTAAFRRLRSAFRERGRRQAYLWDRVLRTRRR